MNRLAFGLLLLIAAPALAAEPTPPLGTKITDFTLKHATDGSNWNFAQNTRNAKAIVVVFPSTACPVSLAYIPKLIELEKKYRTDNVQFLAVYSHDYDDAESIAAQAKEFKITYPLLKDADLAVADKFHVDRVPTAFVLDAARTVRYQGRIDDQFSVGVHKAKATTRELGNAIDAILSKGPTSRFPKPKPAAAASPAKSPSETPAHSTPTANTSPASCRPSACSATATAKRVRSRSIPTSPPKAGPA